MASPRIESNTNMSIKQAIEALETAHDLAVNAAAEVHEAYRGHYPERHAAADADVEQIVAALAALRSMPAEPVAWGMCKNGLILDCITPAEHESYEGEYTVPLFATPHTAPVPLSDAELTEMWNYAVEHSDPTAGNAHIRYGRAVERAVLGRGGEQ